MPPVMMTTVMPSAMMPNGAKLRVMLATLSTVPKLGSSDSHEHDQHEQRDRHPEGLAGDRRAAATVCSLMPMTSEMAA